MFGVFLTDDMFIVPLASEKEKKQARKKSSSLWEDIRASAKTSMIRVAQKPCHLLTFAFCATDAVLDPDLSNFPTVRDDHKDVRSLLL